MHSSAIITITTYFLYCFLFLKPSYFLTLCFNFFDLIKLFHVVNHIHLIKDGATLIINPHYHHYNDEDDDEEDDDEDKEDDGCKALLNVCTTPVIKAIQPNKIIAKAIDIIK